MVALGEGQGGRVGETVSAIVAKETFKGLAREQLNQSLREQIAERVGSIWVLIVPLSRTSKVVHVQVYLKSGEVYYQQVLTPTPNPEFESKIPDYRDRDFRKEAEDRKLSTSGQ